MMGIQELTSRLRSAAQTMRKYRAASLEASDLDDAADMIDELEAKLIAALTPPTGANEGET